MTKAIPIMALLLAACGGSDETSPVGSGAGGSSSQPVACDVTIQLLDFKLEPSAVELPAGTVTLCAENAGEAPHDLAVRDGEGDLGRTSVLSGGDSDRVTFEVGAGEYDIYCSRAGHESLGMKGTLTITR